MEIGSSSRAYLFFARNARGETPSSFLVLSSRSFCLAHRLPVCGTLLLHPTLMCCSSALLSFSLFLGPQALVALGPGGNVACEVQSLASGKHSEHCQGGGSPECPWMLFCERLWVNCILSTHWQVGQTLTLIIYFCGRKGISPYSASAV